MRYAQTGEAIPENLYKRDGAPANTDSLGATIPTTVLNEFINEIRLTYGQLYNNGNGTLYYTFKTRPVKAYVNYLDYGARMLEAQFPHKLIYEHQNVLDSSYYMIRGVQNPLYISDKFINLENPVYINDAEKNRRHFEEIELDPYLKNGYGFVRFDAHTEYKDIDYWDGEEYTKKDNNILTIQVTDLGITTRMGINRAVVMVRSLSTNKPVADADVYVLNECSRLTDDPLDHILAQGKTDKDGLAIINYTEEQIAAYERNHDYDYSYQDNLTVYVAKGDDKATYQVPEGDWNLIIISGNTGIQTYDSVMNANCIGDTCYVMDEPFENPVDSKKVSYGLGWRNNPDCGPHKVISSLGNIIGNAYLPGETNQTIYDNFVKKYADTWGNEILGDLEGIPQFEIPPDPDRDEKWEALKQELAEKLGLNTKTDKSKEYKSIVVTSDSNYAGFLSAILMADTGAALLLVKKKHNSDTD